jgi:hypothetical protein
LSVHTFKDLTTQVLSFLDEAGSVGITRTNVQYALNQAHFQRLTEQNWPFMIWDRPESFSLVQGVQQYSLHPEFLRPISFFNRTQGTFLEEVPMRNYQAVDQTALGQTNFVLWGEAPVQAQPAAASVLTIVSDSSSDTGAAFAITVTGDTPNGIRSETISPNGVTPVSGAVQFTKVTGVSKPIAWNGMLTVSAGAVTLLKLFATEFGRSYQQIYFPTSPSSPDTIEYRFYKRPAQLVNDGDIPQIRFPFSQILVWDALKTIYGYDGQLDPGRAQLIKENQDRLDLAMRQAFLDGQSINAQPRRIRYIAD